MYLFLNLNCLFNFLNFNIILFYFVLDHFISFYSSEGRMHFYTLAQFIFN